MKSGYYGIIIALFAAVLLCGCAGKSNDARLIHIEGIVSDNPGEALAMLDSIGYEELSDADRHFYDFLMIKAKDKAYIVHESDSLILDVVSYYKGSELYPEALYYAGRVYSDLGDYPMALRYFQESLDNISGDAAGMLGLKGRVLSQTGRLLNRLRLYERSIPYIQESIKVDSIRKDTFSLAYDNELLGAVYLHLRNSSEATACFVEASGWAAYLTDMDMANMQMQLAAAKICGGDIDSAVMLIRGTPEKVHPQQRNEAMIYASDIYLAAGIQDSAYIYANRLVHSDNENNRKNGYRNLFSPALFGRIPSDSIPAFIRDYYTCLEKYYNDHDAQRALMQDAFYNYQQHVREREKAEERNRYFVDATVILVLIVLVSAIIILYLRDRRKILMLRLHNAIHELERLRKSMSSESPDDSLDIVADSGQVSELEILKARLREQIDLLKKQNSGTPPVDSSILDSDILASINRFIASNKVIPSDSSVWTELERTILSTSPCFKEHLWLLAGKRLKELDYHIVLLIRSGITPSQMTILLGRTKSTVSYHRRHICEMVMGENIGSDLFDSIIRCI